MALIESGLLSKVGTSLATGIVKQAGARFAKRLRKTETEKALERCGRAAVEALVEEGFPEGTDIPRDHLEGVLGRFAEDEVAHDVLARALREGTLPADEVTQLRECFEEHHPPETLPGFDVERGIAAFVTAFVDRADEEAGFQGIIQTKELRAQTRYLRDQLGEAQEQTGLLKEIRDRTPDPQKEAETARARYLEELRHRCLMLPVTRLLGDEGLERPLTLDRVYQELDTKTPKEKPGETTDKRSRARRTPGLERKERLSALEALEAENHLVLLGEAGSGKSTFARAVLAGLAGSGLDESSEPPAGLSRDLVPVFVALRELSGRLQGLELDGLSGEKRTGRLAEAVREQALADLSEDLKVVEFAGVLERPWARDAASSPWTAWTRCRRVSGAGSGRRSWRFGSASGRPRSWPPAGSAPTAAPSPSPASPATSWPPSTRARSGASAPPGTGRRATWADWRGGRWMRGLGIWLARCSSPRSGTWLETPCSSPPWPSSTPGRRSFPGAVPRSTRTRSSS